MIQNHVLNQVIGADNENAPRAASSDSSAEPALMSQDRWLQEFIKYARVKSVLQAQDRVLVSVSGGLDSSVLAHLMARAARLIGFSIEYVHVDHRTRGLSSEREGSWVKALGDRLGVKTHLLTLPERKGDASQADLRRLRRSMLTQLLAERGFNKIATAHHADDNAETFLMRAISGTGVTGLGGMTPFDGTWAKPLLWATKKDLEEYARRFRLGWVEDPSNAITNYLRNRLRHDALPLLETIRQGAIANMARAAERIDQEEREWEEWIAPQLEGPVETLSRALLEKYPEALQRRIFRVWLSKLGIDSDPALVEALLSGQEVVHQAGAFLRRSDMYVFSGEKEFGSAWKQGLPVELGKRVTLGSSTAWSFLKGGLNPSGQSPTSLKLSVFFLFRPPTDPSRANQQLLAWDSLPWPLMVRTRNAGDPGRELDEILSKHRVPRPFWKAWPLLVSQEEPSKIIALIGVEVLKNYRLQELGRCVSMECFFEDSLRSVSRTC